MGRWADPECLAPPSFELHARLADEHNGEENWGYRKVTSADCDTVRYHNEAQLQQNPVTATRGGLISPDDLDWVKSSVFKWFKPLGDTAQVHPYLFTNAVLRLALEAGVELITGQALSITRSENGKEVKSVLFRDPQHEDSRELPATNVILAAGPWTRRILPEAPIGAEKSHSIVVDPKRPISGSILFFDPGNVDVKDLENQLEIYPRPDSTVYMSGQTDYGMPLPDTTEDVHVDEGRCEKLLQTVGTVSEELGASEIRIKQACFRPLVEVEGRDVELGPFLGETGVKGLLLAAGHNQWGIQNSPISGKVLSELVFEGVAKSANISILDPREHLRF